jgi:hypothetical protein
MVTDRNRGCGHQRQDRGDAHVLVLVPVCAVECQAALGQGEVVGTGGGVEHHTNRAAHGGRQLQPDADGGRPCR